MNSTGRTIYIDPSYVAYYQDRLFDLSDTALNRDGTLLPFARLRTAMNAQGREVRTADHLLASTPGNTVADYYSLGLLDNYPKLVNRHDVSLRGFLIMEPPVVAPKLYRALPEITRYFDKVFLHNTEGDGYSLKGVDRAKLKVLYWPQPYGSVLERYWSNVERENRIVVINGNHIPRSLHGQLYAKRIEVMASLAKTGIIDLYGRGWDQWWSHRSMWPPYWLNYRKLMSIYCGPCESKYEVLARYRFSLCFENMAMQGYVTEKIFDCLYAGCIPIYLGAKNVENLIPPSAYIDARRFTSWSEMSDKLRAMSDQEVAAMRNAGRGFIQGAAYQKYHDSLINIVYG